MERQLDRDRSTDKQMKKKKKQNVCFGKYVIQQSSLRILEFTV